MKTTTRWAVLVAALAGLAGLVPPAAAAAGLTIHLSSGGHHLYSERSHPGPAGHAHKHRGHPRYDKHFRHDGHSRHHKHLRHGKRHDGHLRPGGHRHDLGQLHLRNRHGPPHHHRHGRARYRCHPVSKVIRGHHGRPLKIAGRMCYDAYGAPYIVPGSRYVAHGR